MVLKMNPSPLNDFKDFVEKNYPDSTLTIDFICSRINCLRKSLYRAVDHEYKYSPIKYIEYYKIWKAIEFIFEGEIKIHDKVGYKSPSGFSRTFSRITGFNMKQFYSYVFDHKDIIETARSMAAENPKKAIEFIVDKIQQAENIISDRAKTKNKKDKKKVSQMGKKCPKWATFKFDKMIFFIILYHKLFNKSKIKRF